MMAPLILVAALLAAAPLRAESLYQPQQHVPLVADLRARHVGDSITILVVENSSAATSARSNLGRRTEAGAHATVAADGRDHRLGGGAGTDSQFEGGGTVQRSDRLLAQITATVVREADNGELWIAGEHQVEINSDRRQIRVEGRVRATDIGRDNSVQSNRLADARITYVGDGQLSERQNPGWLAKLLLWLGL